MLRQAVRVGVAIVWLVSCVACPEAAACVSGDYQDDLLGGGTDAELAPSTTLPTSVEDEDDWWNP